MRKNVFKIAAFLLGSALVISSCVKTEELDSVKAIREAKAASLTASSNYTDAQTKGLLADLAVKRFNTWMDSVQLVANLAEQTIRTQQNAAQAQAAIERAALQLATDKLSAQEQQKQIQDRITILLKTNPELALLVQDYNTYYGGNNKLSTNVYIGKGIYTLRANILTLQQELIGLRINQGNEANSKISMLAMYNRSLASDSAYLKSNQKTLALYQSAKTDGIGKALVTATAQAATAYSDYQTKYTAYYKASSEYDVVNSSSNEYSTAINDSINSSSTIFNILSDYEGSLAVLQQIITSQTDIVSKDKTTLDKYLVLLADTNKILENAKVAYNTTQANLLSAQAAVNAATMNGGTASPTQLATLTEANTANNNAQIRLNQVSNQYFYLYNIINNNGPNYSWWDGNNHSESGLLGEYDYNNYRLKSEKKDLTNYTEAKTKLDAATAKIPALRTDYNTKLKVKDDTYRAYQLANIANNAASNLVTNLTNLSNQSAPSGNLDQSILDYTGYINNNQADIANDKSNIANIDIKTATTTVATIAAKTNEIAELQALIDSYTTKAAALKVKIDAAQ